MGQSWKVNAVRRETLKTGSSWEPHIFETASLPVGFSPLAEPSPVSARNSSRALSRLTSLLRASRLLSTQETLDFACSFLDEAHQLASVVMVHDRGARPLVWGTGSTSCAALARACAEAEATYAQMMIAAHDDPGSLWGHEAPSGTAPRVITLPLSIPLLGVIRVESTDPPREGELSFLRHAVILLSLAVDRCADSVTSRAMALSR